MIQELAQVVLLPDDTSILFKFNRKDAILLTVKSTFIVSKLFTANNYFLMLKRPISNVNLKTNLTSLYPMYQNTTQ